jgi:hypothetical protein
MSKITKIINQSADLGDILVGDFKSEKNLKVASAATAAYRTAIQASKAQMQYFKAKKNGEVPTSISFFE